MMRVTQQPLMQPDVAPSYVDSAAPTISASHRLLRTEEV